MNKPRKPHEKPFAKIQPEARPRDQSGERERLSHLDLDLREFLEGFLQEEPITKPMKYVENLEQLRTIICELSVIRPSGFQKREFASKLVAVDMYTHEKGEQSGYYLAEDKFGNQYRIYLNPEGKIEAPNLDYEKRIVLMGGDRTLYIFPVAFAGR